MKAIGRSWSAGAGSGALATGLVQIAWVLQRVVAISGEVSATTQPGRWLDGGADLLLWEAFVSGHGKPVPVAVSQHAADAAAAAETFADRWQARGLGESHVVCAPSGGFTLAASAALYAGVDIDAEEIGVPVAVYRTVRGV